MQTMMVEPELEKREADQYEEALVGDLVKWCQEAREFWKPVFNRIEEELAFAAGRQWPDQKLNDERYVVNIVGRRLNQKVAEIYAKNPKAVARVRPQLAFVMWDGTQDSLAAAREALADQVIQQAALAGDAGALGVVQQAQAILADYQNGMTRREMLKRWGRTVELVYEFQCDQQMPRFKDSMKALVRRALSARVGWVKLMYRRTGRLVPTATPRASDADQVHGLAQKLNEIAENPGSETEKLRQETELMAEALREKQERGELNPADEGLVFDFPKATSVLVDPECTSLRTLSGCRRVAQEYLLTPDEVERRYGVDVKADAVQYDAGGRSEGQSARDDGWLKEGRVCVWEVYDIETQLKYTVCDGYKAFLEPPTTPRPRLSRFWPLFALVFNEQEVEKNCPEKDVTCYPQSDVRRLMPMQMEMNRSREALREHRIQNRPLYAGAHSLTENDAKMLSSGHPSGYVIRLEGLAPGQSVDSVLQQVRKHPIDPACYDTRHVENDVLLTVGSQMAHLGPTTKATATEVSVAEGSRLQSGSSDVDDLDCLLTELARAGSEMLLAEMPKEIVRLIVGPGASWPDTPIESNNPELWLESEAGSSGRPNRALEVSNFQMLAPVLMQIPGIKPEAMAREAIKRLEDAAELEDFFQPGLPPLIASAQASGMQQSLQPPGSLSNLPRPGERPPTANDPATSLAQQSQTTQGMPSQFQQQTAALSAQPQP